MGASPVTSVDPLLTTKTELATHEARGSETSTPTLSYTVLLRSVP